MFGNMNIDVIKKRILDEDILTSSIPGITSNVLLTIGEELQNLVV